MKYIFQFGIILLVTFAGELLNETLPLPIPASIYGLVLMLLLLITKIIKLEQVKETADFLVEIMAPMFIPAAVGLILVWDEIKPLLVPLLLITALTTVVVMAVTGRVAQFIIRRQRKGDELHERNLM